MQLPKSFSAVVTGGGSGLGRELGLELAQRGGRIVVADLRLEGAEESAEMIRAAGGQAWAIQCDVSKWENVESLAERAAERAGDIDLIANNAGVAVAGEFCDISLEDWRWLMDVNLWGVVYGCRAFLPGMRERGRGWILNVASAAGFASLGRFAPYNVSKAGVISLSETLRAELEPVGIGVTVVCPSFFQTNIADAGRGEDDKVRELISKRMQESKVQANDVARHAIRSLEHGRLHALAMRDARLLWMTKRVFPGSFHRAANTLLSAYERSRLS